MNKNFDIAVAIKTHDSSTAQQSHKIAEQLGLAICQMPSGEKHQPPTNPDQLRCDQFNYYLSFETNNNTPILSLFSTSKAFGNAINVDFVGGKQGHRRQFGGGRGQPLARAIGLKGGENPSVVDATAGLGRDAFVLANLGATVTLIERSPILSLLLKDGLDRLTKDPSLDFNVNTRMQLVNTDAIEWLEQHCAETEKPDVVYLDPMYPHRTKSALVKKEMRVLRDLVGDDDDTDRLLHAALHCAKKRVVVKRPKTAPALEGSILKGLKPSGSVESKNTRYDIYSPA